MSFLDSQGDAAEEGGPPATPPPQAGSPGPPGGGPIIAALANRQRPGPKVSAPGPGDQASSMTMLMQAIGMIQQALPGLPPGTPLHKDALRSVTTLSRHVPQQGGPAAGVQRTQLQDLLQSLMKNALLAQIMGQQKKGAGGGAGPGQPATGGPPMPSTPLPGA